MPVLGLDPHGESPALGEDAFYLGAGSDAMFVSLHRAAGPSATSVILCPPFGWEEVCSYRPRREWARVLARAGYPTLRISLPSTGDSDGAVRDAGRLAAWTSATERAALWLRSATGARRIVAVGMGLGGMMAYLCATGGGEIDDLVLWSTPSRGRTLVRQFRAFSRLEAEQFFRGLPQPPPLPEGELEAGGFRLSAETVRDLQAVDLASADLSHASDRRVLLLERDGIAVDPRLHDRLIELGVSVTTAPAGGYADMTSHPQTAEPAREVFTSVTRWISATEHAPAEASSPAAAEPAAYLSQAPAAESEIAATADRAWSERPVMIDTPSGRLPGVLVAPRQSAGHGLCAVLLNAGVVRRIGPSRMWVETGRRWAEHGVPTLRLDMEGIGDADGPVVAYPQDGLFYRDELVDQVIAALDYLEEHGAGQRFLVGGLCSGSYWALHAAVRDQRVCAAAMLNPRVLVWSEDLAPARYMRTLLSERPSLRRIREVATLRMAMQVLTWAIRTPVRWLAQMKWFATRAAPDSSAADRLLTRLRASGARTMLLFSEREPLHGELLRTGRLDALREMPGVTLEQVAVADHTLRPSWAQAQAQAALDRMLDRELVRVGADPLSPLRTPA